MPISNKIAVWGSTIDDYGSSAFNIVSGNTGGLKPGELAYAQDINKAFRNATIVDYAIAEMLTGVSWPTSVTIGFEVEPSQVSIFASTFKSVFNSYITGIKVNNAGHADTASAFDSAKSIELTGDVTGSISGTSAWTISTTIGTSKILSGMISASAVTSAKISAGAIVSAKISTSAVTTPKISDSAITTAKIADSNVTTEKIANSNITEDKLATSAITTAKIADGSITKAKLVSDILSKADVGLGNVDNTSDATKKSNFTGSIASGNTGFVTGGDVYTSLALKYDKSSISWNSTSKILTFN